MSPLFATPPRQSRDASHTEYAGQIGDGEGAYGGAVGRGEEVPRGAGMMGGGPIFPSVRRDHVAVGDLPGHLVEELREAPLIRCVFIGGDHPVERGSAGRPTP